jgi:hypothetical protein
MNNKFTIVSINNSQVYANEYECCIHSIAISYDKNSDLIIRYKNNETHFEIDAHCIDNRGIHHRGIGEHTTIDDSNLFIVSK